MPLECTTNQHMQISFLIPLLSSYYSMKFVACFVSLQLCHCDNSVHGQIYKQPAFSGNRSEYEKVMAKILE